MFKNAIKELVTFWNLNWFYKILLGVIKNVISKK
jgi:hypothetical protein